MEIEVYPLHLWRRKYEKTGQPLRGRPRKEEENVEADKQPQ